MKFCVKSSRSIRIKRFVIIIVWLTSSLHSIAGGPTNPDAYFIIKIPAAIVNNFINASLSDSAVFICNKPYDYYKLTKDKHYLINNVEVDPDNLQSFLQALIKDKNCKCFRLFYKNPSSKFYKYLDIDANNNIQQEMILTDPINGLYEQTIYYKKGGVLSSSEVRLDTTEEIKNWTYWKAKFIKTGKQTEYYSSGKLMSIKYYGKHDLKDTVYAFFYENGMPKMMYANDSLKFWDKKNYLMSNIPFNKESSFTLGRDDHKKAFLFGVDKYNMTKLNDPQDPFFDSSTFGIRFGDLDGCINDVRLIKNTLISDKGFNPKNIITDTNSMATKANTIRLFTEFKERLNKNDIVFIHFSASSYHFIDSSGNFQTVVACSDANQTDTRKNIFGFIKESELQEEFTDIGNIIGPGGKLIVSMDVCGSGSYSADVKKDSTDKSAPSLRGESNNFLIDIDKEDVVPTIIFTSCQSNELSMEIFGDNDIGYGAYSYALAKALRNPLNLTGNDIYESLSQFISEGDGATQHPQFYTNSEGFVFENDTSLATQQEILPVVNSKGNAYALSIGISQYNTSNSNLKFNNCVSDAKAYDRFFQSEFNNLRGNKKYFSYLLTDTSATKENILNAINQIINKSNPEDYFIFNFSGYCKSYADSTGMQVTYFVPYGLQNIDDSNSIKKYGIPLERLKELLQFVHANNQLFVTEAGSTESFQKEFIQALIQNSPSLASLYNTNRIFIIPNNVGADKFYCSSQEIDHGPLNYYITQLASSPLNLFGIFENDIYEDAVKYALTKAEINCNYFKLNYFDMFSERAYLNDLKFYMPESFSQMRGVKLAENIKDSLSKTNSKRYALVVGSNIYDDEHDWPHLGTPDSDAVSIGRELENGFNYNVKLMINKPLDSIYAYIVYLSHILKSSDQVIIYFAGHGDFDEKLLDDGFIVCKDSKQIDLDPYRNSYIQYSKFERMVNNLPAQQILMILDVCFGGTFDQRVIRKEGRDKQEDYDNANAEQFFNLKMKNKTRLYLTSGGKNVVPDGFIHSPFAQILIGLLQNRGGSRKFLTSRDLYSSVETLKSGPLLGSFGDDEVGSEFVLLAN